MSSILDKIYDDEQEYLYLCRKYGEDPQRNGAWPYLYDIYGDHAEGLTKRERSQEVSDTEGWHEATYPALTDGTETSTALPSNATRAPGT